MLFGVTVILYFLKILSGSRNYLNNFVAKLQFCESFEECDWVGGLSVNVITSIRRYAWQHEYGRDP